MPNIAIVTDSSACLPAEFVQQYRINVVPVALLFNGEVFHDGDLPSADFYARLRDPREHPTTAAPAPGEFLEAFRRASAEGSSAALCLTLSSRYSGAHSSAVNAEQLAARELPGFPVRVIDTGAIAMAHGFAVLAAARSAASGATLDEVAATTQRAAAETNLVGVLDTTRYLARSGRVPWVLHFVASLLRIKPVIAATGGKIRAVGRVRTMDRGIDRIVDYVRSKTASLGAPLRVAVMHTDAPERAQELADRVKRELSPEELLIAAFTLAMAVHTGPGFVGLAWQAADPTTRAAPARASRPSLLKRDVRVLEGSLDPLPAAVERPALIVLSGLPGSGKSHLAREILRRHPVAVLESDALRKALIERRTYSQRESGRLFAACHGLLEELLGRGIPVLLDATNLKEMHRRPLYGIAERTGARLLLVEVRAGEDVVRRRLEGRQAAADNPWDSSDATLEVFEKMGREAEPIEGPHLVVDATGDISEAVKRVMHELQDVTV